MKHLKFTLPILILAVLFSCKKDETEEESVSISITHSAGYSLSLPVTISFTATTNNAEKVTWDFGDGATATGFSTQHTFSEYGCYTVKATASKGGKSVTAEKEVAVTFHRRAVLNMIEVLQIPSFKTGGVDWDPGELPDLTWRLIFPGDTIYETTSVLNNSEKGSFNIIPPRGTYNFEQDTRIEIYDKDMGNTPDKELIGFVPFKFCAVVPDSVVYTDSVNVTNGALRLKLKFTFLN